jgi:hypothetical protein
MNTCIESGNNLFGGRVLIEGDIEVQRSESAGKISGVGFRTPPLVKSRTGVENLVVEDETLPAIPVLHIIRQTVHRRRQLTHGSAAGPASEATTQTTHH